MKIELIPLALNIGIFAYYLYQMQEVGKIFYWLGACLITLGLLWMKG